MAGEAGELAFVTTMRDEATRVARAAKRELERLGGRTKPITVPVDADVALAKKKLAEVEKARDALNRAKPVKVKADADVAHAKAELKALERKRDELDRMKAARIRVRVDRAKEAGKDLAGVGVGLSKILTVAGAAGPAVLAVGSAMSAVAAGGTALIGAVGPAAAAGLAVTAGATLALAQGSVVLHGALDGVAKAAGGSKTELAKLTPAGQRLAKTWADLRPEIDRVRTAAQRGLFPGLNKASAQLGGAYLPLVRKAARQTGAELGGLAAKGAQLVSSGPWRRDFGTVTKANSRNLGIMGGAALSLADGARSLLVTAQPLIRTFSLWSAGAAKTLNAQIQAGRSSGKLAAFWQRAGAAAASLGRIAGNLATALFRVFEIGNRGAGAGLLANVEAITRRFRDWTGSANGAAKIADWFARGRDNLSAMGRLVASVSRGLSSMGSGNSLAPLIDQITRQIIPPLMQFLRNANASGALSSLVSAIGQLLGVLSRLSSADHSLTAFAITLGAIAKAAGFVIDHVPGASAVLAAFFATAGTYGALKLVGLGGVVKGLVGSMMTLGTTTAGTTRTFAIWRAEMAAAQGLSGKTSAALSGLGGTARLAAGAGGLGLVADSSNRSSKALGVLEGAAGGALTGGALGSFAGPPGIAIGAAIGGLTGGLISLSAGAKNAGGSAKASVGSWQSLKSTLDSVTGATTQATRQLVFQDLEKSGALKTLREYGISARQAVTAVTSGGPARDKFVAQIRTQNTALDRSVKVAKDYRDSLIGGNDQQALKNANTTLDLVQKQTKARKEALGAALREMGLSDKAVASMQAEIAATRTFSAAIKTLPKAVQTKIQADGLLPTRKAVVDLARQYKLTPRSIATLIREQGGKPTRAMVQSIRLEAARFPKGLVTRVASTGIPTTRKAIVDLTRQFRLNPKQVSTLIRESGGRPTRAMVESITRAARVLGAQRPSPHITARNSATGVINAVRGQLRALDGDHANTYITTTRTLRTVTTGGVRNASLQALGGTIRRGQGLAGGGTVAGQRAPYGDKVLARTTQGGLIGLAPGEEVISNAKGQADRYRGLLKAINAGGLALGGTVVQALAKGGTTRKGKRPTAAQKRAAAGRAKTRRNKAASIRAAGTLVTQPLVASFTGKSAADVTKAETKLLSATQALYRARGLDSNRAKVSAAAAIKSYAKETAAIEANARARDKLTEQLSTAKDLGASVTESLRSALDVSTIASVNDAPITSGFIVKGLADRLAAIKAFQADLNALRAKGLDEATIGQLAAAGVEQGGAQAKALASATAAQVASINASQAEIAKAAAETGAQATAGLTKGITEQIAQVDKAGKLLAEALLKAVRKRLGIKSPSREAARDGRFVVKGQALGLLAEIPTAERAAAKLAARVQAAAVPSLSGLTASANTAYAVRAVTPAAGASSVGGTVTIRHEVVSPDGSITNLTAAQIADLLARDPKAAAAVERALAAPRGRRRTNTITSSTSKPRA